MYRGVSSTFPLPFSSSTSPATLRLSLLLTSLPSPPPSAACRYTSLLPSLLSPSCLSSLPRVSRVAAPSPPRLSQWIPSMVGKSRVGGRVSFSSGNSGEGNREILVQHLLVGEEDLKLLLELQQRTAAGEDLSDLAVEYSLCPSKENGGMLGWVQRGQMVPEFEEAAFTAPLNKVVRCKTKFGWHLLQVLSEREESVLLAIEPEEFHSKMQDASFFEEVQLIDVREPDEVDQASLPGFKVLPLRQFGTWGSEITNEFDPQKDTYVLCHHGVRSLQVAKWLQTQGFKRIFNISGGIHAYAVKVDASVPTY